MAFKQKSPRPVIEGGTTRESFNPYSVITGGTSPSGALQQVSGTGNSGQLLVSGGAGVLPSWGDVATSGAWVLRQTQRLTNANLVTFTSGMDTTFKTYAITMQGYLANDNSVFDISFSTDGGGTYPIGGPYDSSITTAHFSVTPATIWYGQKDPQLTLTQGPVIGSSTASLSYNPISVILFLIGLGNPMDVQWVGQSYFARRPPPPIGGGGPNNALLYGSFSTSGLAVNAFKFTTFGFYNGSISLYGITQ